MKRTTLILVLFFATLTSLAQGVHIFKSDGTYEVIKAVELDSVVFFDDASNMVYIRSFTVDTECNKWYISLSAKFVNEVSLVIDSCGFCYSTTKDPTLEDNVIKGTLSEENFTAHLGNLTNDEVYYVRPFVSNAYGTVYGETQSIHFNKLPYYGYENGHEWADLGLPSGTLWATMNVGSSSVYDSGEGFAWGEVSPSNQSTFTNYKWCKGTNTSFTKYCTLSKYGTVDNLVELENSDDAAYVNWGSNWLTPSYEQILELINNCEQKYIDENGINGLLMTSKINDNSIFLPQGSSTGSNYFWIRHLNQTYNINALAYYFYNSYGLRRSSNGNDGGGRFCPYRVRPALKK